MNIVRRRLGIFCGRKYNLSALKEVTGRFEEKYIIFLFIFAYVFCNYLSARICWPKITK